MAVINGAKSLEDVVRTVKTGFFAVIRVRLALFYLRASLQGLIILQDDLDRLTLVDGGCPTVHSRRGKWPVCSQTNKTETALALGPFLQHYPICSWSRSPLACVLSRSDPSSARHSSTSK